MPDCAVGRDDRDHLDPGRKGATSRCSSPVRCPARIGCGPGMRPTRPELTNLGSPYALGEEDAVRRLGLILRGLPQSRWVWLNLCDRCRHATAASVHVGAQRQHGHILRASTFAPVLKRNGGGVMVNMLSVVAWYVYPFNSTYCATKHAALAVTDGLRIQLRAQGTLVIGVYAGLIDTEMGATLSSGPKTSPRQVAEKTMQGIRSGVEHVIADDSAASLWQATRQDLMRKHADMQTRWDQHLAAACV